MVSSEKTGTRASAGSGLVCLSNQPAITRSKTVELSGIEGKKTEEKTASEPHVGMVCSLSCTNFVWGDVRQGSALNKSTKNVSHGIC